MVFPLRIKKRTNQANHTLALEITVNNFFGHWIREIDIKRYGDDLPILPLTNTVEIYKYSDATRTQKSLGRSLIRSATIGWGQLAASGIDYVLKKVFR